MLATLHSTETMMRMTRLRRACTYLFWMIIITCILFFVVEGVASTAITFYGVRRFLLVQDHKFMQYDPEIGWTGKPDAQVENAFGPGKTVTRNNRGFRGKQHTEEHIPEGKLRIICSGDSYTFGMGVDDSETWCHLLGEVDQRIESVNLGEEGYGTDQSFLRYRKEAANIDHDVHIFTILTPDIVRMRESTFLQLPRPQVSQVEGGNLVVANVPVPKPAFKHRTLIALTSIQSKLRITELLGSLSRKKNKVHTILDLEGTKDLLHVIMTETKTLTDKGGSVLVVVYLPYDHEENSHPYSPYAYASKIAEEEHLFFIDLVSFYKGLAHQTKQSFFLTNAETTHPTAPGHYSVMGNKIIAQQLYNQLSSTEEIADRLNQL